ncbi:MAG: GtrA family protein [Gammaproteobacteria bacterium]
MAADFQAGAATLRKAFDYNAASVKASAESPLPSNDRLRALLGEFTRFAAAGLLSYAAGAGLSALFREVLGLRPELAVGLSLTILLLTNFGINRAFVFRVSGNSKGEFLRFAIASAVMRGAEFLVFLGLLHLAHLEYLVAFTLALVISNGAKFVLYRTVVFPHRQPVAAPPPVDIR